DTLESAKNTLATLAAGLSGGLAASAQSLSQEVDTTLAQARAESSALIAQIDQRMDAARAQGAELSDGLERKLQETVDRARRQAQAAAEPLRHQLNDELRAHESRIEKIATDATVDIEQRINAFQGMIGGASAD